MINWSLDNPPVTDETGVLAQWVVDQLERLEPLVNQDTWDDLRAPASNLKAGLTSPTQNNTYGWLEFAHNRDEFAFTQFQLPHHWSPGTLLKPHVHWMKTTSAVGEVEWELSYRWAKIGEVMDAAWTVLADFTPDVSDGDTQYQHALTSLGEITTDGIQLSDMLICKLTRLGTSYSGANHYTAPAALLEFDIHYKRSSMGRGSSFEFVK